MFVLKVFYFETHALQCAHLDCDRNQNPRRNVRVFVYILFFVVITFIRSIKNPVAENVFRYAMIKWNYMHIFLCWNSKYISLSWYDIPKHVVPIMILLLLTRKVLNQGSLLVNLMASFRKFYATMAWLSEYPQNRPFLIHDLSLGSQSNTNSTTSGTGTTYPS